MPTKPKKQPKRRKPRRRDDPTLHSLLCYMADSFLADICAAAHEQGRKPRSLKAIPNLAKELALPPSCHQTAGGEFEVTGENFGMPGKVLRLKLGVRLDHHPVSTPAEAKPAAPN